MNGNTFDVVGVMPRGFTFLQADVDVYVPLPIGPADPGGDDRRHSGNVQMVGPAGHRARAVALVQAAGGRAEREEPRSDFQQFRQLLEDAKFRTVAVQAFKTTSCAMCEECCTSCSQAASCSCC